MLVSAPRAAAKPRRVSSARRPKDRSRMLPLTPRIFSTIAVGIAQRRGKLLITPRGGRWGLPLRGNPKSFPRRALECAFQRIVVVGSVVAGAVDEEGGGTVDAAADAAAEVFADAAGEGFAGQVGLEAVNLQADLQRVAGHVGVGQVLLVFVEQVVHLPELPLRRGRLRGL